MNQEEQGKKMGEVIKKAWADEAFKERLLRNATAVLKEEGLEVPSGLEVRAVENTDKVFHLVLPPRPAGGRLTDALLEDVAGGIGAIEDYVPSADYYNRAYKPANMSDFCWYTRYHSPT